MKLKTSCWQMILINWPATGINWMLLWLYDGSCG